jgi:hypothetical protein
MIEADMNRSLDIAADQSPGASQLAMSSEYMLQRRKFFISFDVFREEYWAHFPQSLTKGLGSSHQFPEMCSCFNFFSSSDVSLVFSEFMGN